MEQTRYIYTVFRFMLTVIACGLLAEAQQAKQIYNPDPGVLTSPIDGSTVVRFYYHPRNANRYVYPLVLRVAAANDERMKVAPVLAEGRTVHISLSEMQELVAGMTRSIMMGQQTKGVEVLEDWQMIPVTEVMDVVVIFSKGAARGAIPTKDLCKTLGALDSAIKTPRAHWEFQRFRLYYGCRVPGFDDAKYNDD
ncbi:MAG: hypothetical protein ABSG40_18350 [Terriglobales bacterium]|jgi:hypothetical protein